MSIYYEELEGSPSIVMDREGGSAKRTFRIAWGDIGLAILEIFPGANFGYPYTAAMPGFPWLRATTMSIDPWNPSHPNGFNEVMNTYPGGAKVVVDYAPYKWPDEDFKDDPADGEFQDVTWLETNLTFGGEYLTWPNNGVRWEKGADGSSYSAAADKKAVVFEDINVGVVIPTIEHSYTWNFVSNPPWKGIRACLGKVNKDVFANCAPETLLFSGASASRTYSTVGAPTWKLEYRFSEKCYNYPLTKLKNADGSTTAQGWNHFLRPGTGKFERMVRRNQDGDPKPIYELQKFRQLYGGRA